MSKNSIIPFLKDYLINFLTSPFLLDTNEKLTKIEGTPRDAASLYCSYAFDRMEMEGHPFNKMVKSFLSEALHHFVNIYFRENSV